MLRGSSASAMQVAAPFPGREPLERALTLTTGAGLVRGGIPLNQRGAFYHTSRSSLEESLYRFREHHSNCSARRRAAATFESQKEAQRTELLARKFIETVRQEQGTTSCIGLASNHHSTQPTLPTTAGSTSAASSLSTVVSESEQSQTGGGENPTRTTNMSQSSTICPKLSSFSPSSSPEKKSLLAKDFKDTPTHVSTEEATCSVVVKMEPDLQENHISCSQQQSSQQASTNKNEVGGASGNNALSRTNSGSNTKGKSRIRRTSKDILKNLPLHQTTPSFPNDDSGNDLTLTADDIFNGKIGSTPLLKPLEESEDTIVTPPNVKSSPVTTGTRRSTVTTPTSSTPTNCSAGSSRGTEGWGDPTLRKELDAFSKVLNEVERQEKAKEVRRVSTSFPPGTFPMGIANSTLVSPPPPYPIVTTVTQPHLPQPQYNLQRQYSHPNTPLYRSDSYAIQENSAYSHSTIGSEALRQQSQPHPQPHSHIPLQHLSSSTPSQISTLLSSPICTQSSSTQVSAFDFPPPSQSPHGMTLGYHHGNQLYNTPYSHPSPAIPSDLVWNNTPNMTDYMINSRGPMAGQKRHMSPTQYVPPTKVTHSTIPHLPSNQMTGNYPSQPIHTPCQQYPPPPPHGHSMYSHMT